MLGHSLLFGLIYIWSKYEPETTVNLWGFLIKAFQFPFVLLAIRLLMGGNLIDDLMGLAAGHLYYVLKETVPQQYGRDFLATPQFFSNLVNTKRTDARRQAFTGRGQRVG